MENNALSEIDLKTSIERPRQGVSVQLISEMYGNEVMDTQASFHGEIVISGKRRQAFLAALGKLVDDFRV